MAFTAGQKIRASDLNEQGVIKARASRTTNSGASTGAVVGLLRLDDVPVIAGRAYAIHITGGVYPTGTGTARADITLRFTTDGSTPTTSSPILLLRGTQMFTSGFVEPFSATMIYVPSTNLTLSLLLCFQSVVGGANVSSYGASIWPTEVTITDVGSDTGNSGTSV